MLTRNSMLCGLISAAVLAGGATAQGGPADLDKVEIKGVISAVNISPDRAAPAITVQTNDGRRWVVRLGSIRYLMENGFNPKAGRAAVVSGFRVEGGDVMAIQMELPESNQKLRFRDDEGRPLWRGRGFGLGPGPGAGANKNAPPPVKQ